MADPAGAPSPPSYLRAWPDGQEDARRRGRTSQPGHGPGCMGRRRRRCLRPARGYRGPVLQPPRDTGSTLLLDPDGNLVEIVTKVS